LAHAFPTDALNSDDKSAPVTSIDAVSASVAGASVAQTEVGKDLTGSYWLFDRQP